VRSSAAAKNTGAHPRKPNPKLMSVTRGDEVCGEDDVAGANHLRLIRSFLIDSGRCGLSKRLLIQNFFAPV
jgi:hypothetical protein